MSKPFRVLEFLCGIGGCVAAIGNHANLVAAIDVNRDALRVYSHNFPHPVAKFRRQGDLGRICVFW
jgi:site-specific DNA-cytosine methylase